MEKLSKNLLKLLRGKEAKQEDMAKRYGVSQQTWASWEIGRTLPPNDKKLEMERDFGIPMEVIFYESFGYDAKSDEESETKEV